ncbi:MAG TPA: glycosyltransferase family 4 protein [Longimicrobiales bacterium]|nr:glycosyltransferase family 4 protein [Longimicrobiales bacterium]
MRQRLLFLAHTLPWPPDGGAQIRTYNLLRQLARGFDVTALLFVRGKEGLRQTAATADPLREFAHVWTAPLPQEHSRSRLWWDHARALATGRAYTHYRYDSRQYGEHLGRLLAGSRFDIVHVDSLDLARWLPLLAGLPVACGHHNVESALMHRRAQARENPVMRRYLAQQARRLEDTERRWAPRVALNVAVSAADRDALLRIAEGARCEVAPNGVDLDTFAPGPGRDDGIVFVGGTTWFPNLDALHHFGDDILPLLRAAGVDVPVRWVGRATPPQRDAAARDYGIEMPGYVTDVRPWLRDAACFVAPLRVGGGTRLKILDAWAMGKPVVSTSIGCEGLAARDGENILVRDTPAGFADAIRTVLGDPALRARLGTAARRTVERHYGWTASGDVLIEQYRELAGAPAAVGSVP